MHLDGFLLLLLLLREAPVSLHRGSTRVQVTGDLNKRLPGPHFDPPTKARVREMIQEFDVNHDGKIDREKFVNFILRLTGDTFIVVSQGLIITLVVAPTVAMATKRATEGVPGVGKVVQKLPNSVYASIITVAAVMLQNTIQDA
ncbi:hypothetical protein MLD38_010172 [Melastoma candidum]|uniref:Uncharacterized protein n=1 Tax=Melastoma candidum TaxID=119954 RepID=A0ACB9QZ00_9MYRT|nr:hypothetical protein MLD38_010172 [Melastoma candidum]